MITVSNAFKEAVVQSHRATCRVVVYEPGTDTVAAELLVLDGVVEVDASTAVRRRCNVTALALTAAGVSLVPVDQEIGQEALEEYGASGDEYGLDGDVYGARTRTVISGLLTPYGTEFSVYRGINLPDNTLEEVALGRFLLTDADFTDDARGIVVTLTGSDLSQRVSNARWTDLYVVAAGTNYGTAIEDLIDDRVGGLTYNFDAVTDTTPTLIFGEDPNSDPWRDATKMAAAIGHQLYFDGNGDVRLSPLPGVAFTDPSVWDILDGDGGILLSLRRNLSSRPTFNGIIVAGERLDNGLPYRGEAWDENPDSPTYRYGPFGEKPRFLVSRFITSSGQAQNAAVGLLDRYLGLDESLELTIVPMPALDVYDIVKVRRMASNVNAKFIINRLIIPLSPSASMVVSVQRSRTPDAPEEE